MAKATKKKAPVKRTGKKKRPAPKKVQIKKKAKVKMTRLKKKVAKKKVKKKAKMPTRSSAVKYTFKNGVKHGSDGSTAYPSKCKESTSSNGLTKYLTILWTDDTLSCDCRGWAILKKDSAGNPKPRTCKHCKASEASDYDDMTAVDQFQPGTANAPRSTQLDLSDERQWRGIRFRNTED